MSFLKGKSGVNWATNGEERYEEYQSRKQRDFSRRIPLLFDELTEAVGEMESGSVNILMASTSTGKSWCGALQALIGWKNGYRTLYESGEMGKDEVMFRLDSLFSAMTFHQGFNNKGLWRGDLENEEEYKRFTDQFHKNNGKQDFIIKTPSDWKKGLTLEQIEYDVRQTGADLVVIDQWSLIKSNGNSHEARAALSVDLKSLAAKLGIIVFLLYQTDSAFLRDKPKKDEHKPDILTAPTLANFSQTIQVIQDASLILGWNSTMFKGEDGKYVGKAIINVLKARNGGSEELNLSFLPNLGIIRPIVATDLF
jgi:replicative DNA helicase